ncbi:hypothetical protein AMECASPLE_002964 [Ameca splendens]|uniref:Uncharacterized protein n=1 Tax=Ameca splendens TaxID=208324 RepID=A0ABV1A4Q2_9TELE
MTNTKSRKSAKTSPKACKSCTNQNATLCLGFPKLFYFYIVIKMAMFVKMNSCLYENKKKKMLVSIKTSLYSCTVLEDKILSKVSYKDQALQAASSTGNNSCSTGPN